MTEIRKNISFQNFKADFSERAQSKFYFKIRIRRIFELEISGSLTRPQILHHELSLRS